MGLDDADTRAAQYAWSKVLTAVEQRVEAIDPDSGGFNEIFCWPVWRIYDRHWLAVIEAAGLYVVEPLLPAVERARLEPQLRLWPGHITVNTAVGAEP